MAIDLTQLTVLAAGPGFLGLNKPSGLSTHNDPGNDAIEAAMQMLRLDSELQEICAWDGVTKPSPAHRLDRETSGCLLLALNPASASRLQQAFERRECEKIYRVVVRGKAATTGRWTQPLSERAEGRRDPAGQDRKPADTAFEVLRANAYFSDLRVSLGSGRQHQIRRHAALNGHVVINDSRYGDPKHISITQKYYGVSRLMLHAEKLTVLDVELEAPLPPEFARLFPEGGSSK